MLQATVPDESRADVAVHGFWTWVTSALFDMRIVNLDEVSYMCQTYVKSMETAEKENKDKYVQPCLYPRRTFTPMVYSMDEISVTEAVDA